MLKTIYKEFPENLHPFLKELLNKKKYVLRKASNLFINRIERSLKKTRLISYPFNLTLDPTNICNLKCPLCPTWQDVKARPKGKMDIKTFKMILDEIGPYLFVLNLCNWGEPFLNPELPAMIEYAKRFNIVVGFSTNLNYLPDETARRIVEAETDIIVISLDGATQESYSKYRRGGDIEAVFKNIEKLNSFKKSYSSAPLLVWQFLVNRYNESEMDTARNLAQKMGVVFQPSSMRTSMGNELLLPLSERIKEIEDWLPKNSAFNKYNYEIVPETKTEQAYCKWLWTSTVVNWDGSISPCCAVFQKSWDFATCYDEKKRIPIHKAWNSPRYELARRLVAAYLKKSSDLTTLIQESEQEGLICLKCIRHGFLES